MQRRRRTAGCIALLLSVALAVAGCSAGANEKSSAGNTKDLRIAMALGDASGLDPARQLADAQQLIIPLWGDTLVDVDQKNPTKIVPALAESWESSDDAKSFTFKLRKDVKFSTGAPMTAKDVKYSLDRVKYIAGPPSFKLSDVTAVTAVDDYTVKIDIANPDSSFVARMATQYFAVLDSADLAKNGGSDQPDAATADKASEYLDAKTIGTGPYMLKSWDRNQQMVFEKNPNYWGSKPVYDQITLKDVRTAATQSQLIAKGDVDIAMDIDPDTAKSAASGVKTVSEQSYNLIYLALNNVAPGVPELANPKVRQAIQKAIDYDGISKGLAEGAPRPAAMVPLGFQGSKDVKPTAYNVEDAKKLMAEAGVTSLAFDVKYANVTWYGVPQKTLWEKLAADLSKIGITVTLQPVEYDAWVTAFRNHEIPMTTGLWAPDYFDSSGYLDVFGRQQGLVAARVSAAIPGGEELYQEYLATVDSDKRKGVAADQIEVMKDDASIVPIVQPNKIILYSDTLTGVSYSPNKQVTIASIKPA